MTKEERDIYIAECNLYEAQAKKTHKTRIMPNDGYNTDNTSDIIKLINLTKDYKHYPILKFDHLKSERLTLDLYDHYSKTGNHIIHYKFDGGWVTVIRKDTCQSFTFRWWNDSAIKYGSKVVSMNHDPEYLLRIIEEQLDAVKFDNWLFYNGKSN